VGKARWESVGEHQYTGIFRSGGDTGFARLSTSAPVNEDVDSEEEKMTPTIAVKFLRDHIDSANTFGNLGL